jgi:hypothetical protein
MNQFQVVENEFGLLVIGRVSIDMMVKLMGGLGDEAQWCPGIGSAYGRQNGVNVSLAVAKSVKASEAWRAELDAKAEKLGGFDAWLYGTDTGVSSEVIFRVLTGRSDMIRSRDLPSDCGDLGRCLRLVDRFGWADRLGEVAVFDARWRPFVTWWVELVRLYDARDWKGLQRLIDECVTKGRGEVSHG